MADSKVILDNNQSTRITKNLESQIDEIMDLFNFGEKLYPYENIRGSERELNEDLRRKQIARNANWGPTSMYTL